MKGIWIKILITIVLFILFLISSNRLSFINDMSKEKEQRKKQLLSIISSREMIEDERLKLEMYVHSIENKYSIDDNIDFLNYLNDILKNLNIKASSLKPIHEETKKDEKVFKIYLETELVFNKLIKLIQNIECARNYTRIDKLHVRNAGTGKKLKIKMELSTINYL